MKSIKNFTLWILLLAIVPLCSCDDDQITAVSLAGKIAGQDWEMKFGKATIEDGDPGYFALFLPTETTEISPCDVFVPNTRYVTATIPRTPGYYTLPFPIANQFTFQFNGQFLIPASGFVEIKSIEGNFVTGTLSAQGDDSNFIYGDFILTVCPND